MERNEKNKRRIIKREYTLLVCFFVVNNSKICYNKIKNNNKKVKKMNKIHNNLSIENLVKTGWFKKTFNKKQRNEIELGLEYNLDIGWYAKPEFTHNQMWEIRWGLEENLDVSIYAKTEFNEDQMYEIKAGLFDKLDVSIYAKECFNKTQMKEIRWGLQDNLDVSVYAKPEISWQKMKAIRIKMLKERKNNEQNT